MSSIGAGTWHMAQATQLAEVLGRKMCTINN